MLPNNVHVLLVSTISFLLNIIIVTYVNYLSCVTNELFPSLYLTDAQSKLLWIVLCYAFKEKEEVKSDFIFFHSLIVSSKSCRSHSMLLIQDLRSVDTP